MDCADDVIGHMSNSHVILDTDRKVTVDNLTVPLYNNTPRLTWWQLMEGLSLRANHLQLHSSPAACAK